MTENKEYFHRVSKNLENLFKEYKLQFPQNYGVLIREFVPKFIMVISVLIFFYMIFNSTNKSFLVGLFVAPMFFVFGLLIYIINKKKTADNTNDNFKKIVSLKAQLIAYEEYPDVNKYLHEFDSQLNYEKNKKEGILKKFKVVKYTIYGSLVIFILIGFSRIDFDKIRNEVDTNEFGEYLELEEDIPFLTLKPLTTEIADGCKVESKSINIYMRGSIKNFLRIDKLKISGADSTDYFRVLLTDKNGTPILRSPRFVYNTNNNEILSSYICYDPVRKGQNDFEALKVLKALDDNKNDNLFFVVEKLNWD